MGKKGISPLIAAVLLVAFTMTVAAILATWSSSFVKTRTQSAEQKQREIAYCEDINMEVESAKYDPGAGEITALAWNIGDTNLTDFQINVYYSEINVTSKTPSNSNKTTAPGDFVTLKVSNIDKTPKKIGILSMKDKCPEIQPLYECSYTGKEFVC